MITIYLAGNTHELWREELKEMVFGGERDISELTFLEPFQSPEGRNFFPAVEGTSPLSPGEYTTRDLLFIDKADLVFAYLHPYSEYSRHVGTSAEVGYARGLNKRIIIVDEFGEESFEFLKQMADVVFENLGKGATYLRMLALHWG